MYKDSEILFLTGIFPDAKYPISPESFYFINLTQKYNSKNKRSTKATKFLYGIEKFFSVLFFA